MGAFEKVILNPVEFTPELPEIDLSALGIAIADPGPNYGESSVTVQRVKQAISEGVTSADWIPVECEIPLILSSDPSVTQAAAFKPVETFVAEIQRRKSAWLRREFADAAGFAGAVGCFVDAAGITTPKGKGHVDQVTLKLSRYPIWFATVEEEFAEVKGVSVRDLQEELAELLGTAPGLITVRVKNEGTEDWRGCYLSLECDDFSSAATALPKYEAKDLTLKGGSTKATVSGAEVVKCPALTAGWVTVLESPIGGTEHMTHVGPRRMILRINDVSTVLEDVKWKLEWRTLGAATWNQTMVASTPLVVSSPVIGNYQLIDFGEVRPEVPVTGEPRFQWRLQAMSKEGLGKQPLIRDVYPMSTEQWARVSDSAPDPADGAPVRAPGTVEDATGVGTVSWANPANAKVVDGSCAVASVKSEVAIVSHYLKATNFGFALPASAIVKGIEVSVRIKNGNGFCTLSDVHAQIVKAGAVQTTGDKGGAHSIPLADESFRYWSYGSGADLWGQTLSAADINNSGFGFAFAVSLNLNAINKTVAKAEVDAISITVTYSESANTETHVCFASRSMDFSDTGVRRQHISDEIWGDMPAPEGVLLRAPAPGQAGQNARLLVIPSVGDLAARADSASLKLSAKVSYRPGFLFATEAADSP